MHSPIDVWEGVLRDAGDADVDEAEWALYQVGAVLSRYRADPTVATIYDETEVPRALLRLTLSPARIDDAVQTLLDLAGHLPQRAESIVFSMHRMKAQWLAQPLARFVSKHGARITPDARVLILRTLRRCIIEDPETIVELRQDVALTSMLQGWQTTESAESLPATKLLESLG